MGHGFSTVQAIRNYLSTCPQTNVANNAYKAEIANPGASAEAELSHVEINEQPAVEVSVEVDDVQMGKVESHVSTSDESDGECAENETGVCVRRFPFSEADNIFGEEVHPQDSELDEMVDAIELEFNERRDKYLEREGQLQQGRL